MGSLAVTEYIVTDFLKVLLGNVRVNPFKHATMGVVFSIARQQSARQWTG
jgi:hypothetical protein